MFAHMVLTVLAAATPPDSLLSADSLLAELRKGGYTMVWRHTATDRSVQEPMNYQNTPRFQQRNLTDRGIADARVVGAIFKSRGIPIGDVFASPMFRTRETAEYAFGHVADTALLRQVDPSPEQRRLIAVAPAAGTNRVLVTHHFVIERNVPGIKPGMVDEGEAVIVRGIRGDSIQLVGIFKMADWQRLGDQLAKSTSTAMVHGAPPVTKAAAGPVGPLVIPALLTTPERVAIGEYFRAFNSGDAARMRQFYEHAVVPNPERTMEQRMEVYNRLKGDLGTLAIVSAEAGEGSRVVVKAQSSAGTPATITFTSETQAPYRIVTISFQMMAGGGGN